MTKRGEDGCRKEALSLRVIGEAPSAVFGTENKLFAAWI